MCTLPVSDVLHKVVYFFFIFSKKSVWLGCIEK